MSARRIALSCTNPIGKLLSAVRCPGSLPKAFFNKSKTYIIIACNKDIDVLNGIDAYCRPPQNNVNLKISRRT